MEEIKLPDYFLLGTSTSALQIEGGDSNNSWYRWAEEGNIKDGTHCVDAVNHWNMVDEDIEIMKALNCNTYRMGIEWSRIEPERGHFSKEAIDRYRWEIEKLIEAGIKPLVTLHHFSNPLWFEDSGGWLNKDCIDLFERYTEFVLTYIGDLVSDWITINEPNVYLINGYIFGIWPPGKKSTKLYFKGARNMILAHIKSYKKIHEVRDGMKAKDTMVGVSNHIRIFDPKKETFLDKWVCKKYDEFFQDIFITGMTEGKLTWPIGQGYPLGKGVYFDFFGVNYYSRDIISFIPRISSIFGNIEVKAGALKNDLGWEIYPEGIYRVCKKYYERFNVPIFITENGICDKRDSYRIKFIYDHLYNIKRLIDDGVDVKRYYHWTLLDNFEWIEGLNAKFGLVGVYPKTNERIIKKSGSFYGEICKNKGVTKKTIDKYLKAW